MNKICIIFLLFLASCGFPEPKYEWSAPTVDRFIGECLPYYTGNLAGALCYCAHEVARDSYDEQDIITLMDLGQSWIAIEPAAKDCMY